MTPAPGLVLIEEIPGSVWETKRDKTKLLKGKVLAVGGEQFTKFGALIKPTCKTGDTVWFLSYIDVGAYDAFKDENGKQLFCTEFLDIRIIL